VRAIEFSLVTIALLASGVPHALAVPMEEPRLTSAFFPGGTRPGEWSLAVGLTLDVLPTEIVESETRILPRAAATFRYGLPFGFSLEGSLEAIVLSNEFGLGGGWSLATGPISWSVRDRLGLWLGYVGLQGFDTSALGLVQHPSLVVGITLGGHHLSLDGELILTHASKIKFGEAAVSSTKTTFDGFSIRILVESPAGPGRLYFGPTFVRASPDYQLWLAFSDLHRKFDSWRLVLGYEF
jgi:hypothetical protein